MDDIKGQKIEEMYLILELIKSDGWSLFEEKADNLYAREVEKSLSSSSLQEREEARKFALAIRKVMQIPQQVISEGKHYEQEDKK